jgi:hypothetical protein
MTEEIRETVVFKRDFMLAETTMGRGPGVTEEVWEK